MALNLLPDELSQDTRTREDCKELYLQTQNKSSQALADKAYLEIRLQGMEEAMKHDQKLHATATEKVHVAELRGFNIAMEEIYGSHQASEASSDEGKAAKASGRNSSGKGMQGDLQSTSSNDLTSKGEGKSSKSNMATSSEGSGSSGEAAAISWIDVGHLRM